ncbi:MAG TPA: hypothetical protein VHV31_17145, partial [Nitrolancea sp.]|nr:hypothetical protein [Nitrolancea sp.]
APTIHSIAMRVLGEPDICLTDRALLPSGSLAGRSAQPQDGERGRPWRSYAALYRWALANSA